MNDHPMFDETLPLLVSILKQEAGPDFAQDGTIIRDASGRLAFVAARTAKDEQERESLNRAVSTKLGPYARKEGCVRFADDPGAAAVTAEQSTLPIRVGDDFYRLLDRRIVGSGWLNEPLSKSSSPPRFVFATLKGGVGRSTALTVAAADLARRGRNVLVIDLDLEAPGLGDLLLNDERTPAFGVIDYLVEVGIADIRPSRLQEFIGTSPLTSAGGGRVDVMPALGKTSITSPENVLAKLSRAMTEDVSSDGGVVSVDRQIANMIHAVTEREQYDVVFIDSRAGLSELAAPAVLGLGATVLLFGTAQRQTVEGYRALFAALQLLAQRDRALGKEAEWRSALRPVYAKSSMDEDIGQRFAEDIYELYSAHIYDAEDGLETNGDAFRFLRDDPDGPHQPLVIPFNANFIDFDPARHPSHLTSSFYEQTFRPFLDGIDKAMSTDSTDKSVA